MREEMEIIIAQAQPWIDRNSPPPGYTELETVKVALENPRGNHRKRHKAAQEAVDKWLKDNSAQMRSMNPTQGKGGKTGFLVIVDGYKPKKRKKPVARAGVHAPRNKLVKR